MSNKKKNIDNIIKKIVDIINESDSDSDLDQNEYNQDSVSDLINIVSNNTINEPQPTLDHNDCYEVDELLDVKIKNNKTEYLVKWVGDWDNTWEPEENINYSLIRNFQINKQINQHNQSLQNTLNLTNQQSNGNAHIYLRVSDKTKTNNLFNRTNNTNNTNNFRNQINVNQLPENVSTYQAYFTAFPEGNFSIDSQKTIIMKYCLEKKLLISSIKMDDGISGRYYNKRIGLKEIISTIKKDEYLLFLDISRFSRNASTGIQILDQLHKQGVKIYSVLDGMNYDTPSSQHFVRTTLSSAQFESDLKSAKVKASIQNIKDKGGYIGSTPPYGYKIMQKGHLKKLVENSYEQKILKIIGRSISVLNSQSLQGEGKYKIIASQLNSQHIKYRGKAFTPNSIKYLIKHRVPDEYFTQVSQSDEQENESNLDMNYEEDESINRKRKKNVNKPKNTSNTSNMDKPKTRKRVKLLALELKDELKNNKNGDNKNIDNKNITKRIKKRRTVQD